jgi:hypothetical protein
MTFEVRVGRQTGHGGGTVLESCHAGPTQGSGGHPTAAGSEVVVPRSGPGVTFTEDLSMYRW